MSAVIEKVTPRLRSMLIEDIVQVMKIENAIYHEGWTAGIFADCIRVGYSCWVWDQPGSGIVGYGVMSVNVGEAHILNITVAEACQGQGLGRRMLNHLLGLAREHDAEDAFLEVRPSNRAAIHLYDSEGFCQVGLRRNYYPGEHGREDAMIMAKHLEPKDQNL